VLLGWLSLHAASMGLANLQVIRVENALNRWAKLAKVPSASAMASALASIDRAIDLHPDNPYQLTLKAQVIEWRGVGKAINGEPAEAYNADFRAALELHRQATYLRPLWPDTWADMANMKLRLNELDEELDRYLAQADKFGPYTAPVHLSIVKAGLAKLAQSKFTQIPLLNRHMLRGLKDPRTKQQIETLVMDYGYETMVCEWLAQAPEMEIETKLCK